MDCGTPGPSVPHHLLKFAQVHVHGISDAIQPSHLLMPSSPFAFNLPSIRDFSNELSVHIRWPKYQSFSFSISPTNEYSGWFQDWQVWSPCCPIDFQESFLAPQLKGINSLAFCHLYGPTLTTVHDHWEGHSLDYMDLCWQSNVSAFQHII